MNFFSLCTHVISFFRLWRQNTTIKCVRVCLRDRKFSYAQMCVRVFFVLLNWSNSYVTQIEFLRSQKRREKNKKRERKHRSPFVNFFYFFFFFKYNTARHVSYSARIYSAVVFVVVFFFFNFAFACAFPKINRFLPTERSFGWQTKSLRFRISTVQHRV